MELLFKGDYRVRATLTPVGADSPSSALRSSNRAAATPGDPEVQPLPEGTKYVVAVYGDGGAYVAHEEYTHGSGATPQELSLAPGEYTFIAVSSGSNTLPEIDYNANLSTISFTDVEADVDLMYQNQTVEVTSGNNSVTFLMEHLFTQIVVTLNSVEEFGNILSINGGTVSPHQPTAAVSLADGSVTLSGAAGERDFTFPGDASGLSWTSSPVMILNATTGTGTVVLKDVTINTTTRDLVFDDLNIRAGVKYMLKIDLGPEEVVTDIDGNVYTTVVIGDLEWMVENLKVTKYNNGDPIPTGLSDAEWANTYNNGRLGAYAAYPYTESGGLVSSEEEMIETYGLLYNGFVVHDTRGLAPEGWRVATDEDFKALELAAGLPEASLDGTGWRAGEETSPEVSLKLRSTIRWNGTVVDNLGFEALPAGRRIATGNPPVSYAHFANAGGNAVAVFWTSTDGNEVGTLGYRRVIQQGYQHDIHRGAITKRDGFSVRCVRDR